MDFLIRRQLAMGYLLPLSSPDYGSLESLTSISLFERGSTTP